MNVSFYNYDEGQKGDPKTLHSINLTSTGVSFISFGQQSLKSLFEQANIPVLNYAESAKDKFFQFAVVARPDLERAIEVLADGSESANRDFLLKTLAMSRQF